ncbi:hypothetical protein D3C72_176250 [compost metagenome]
MRPKGLQGLSGERAEGGEALAWGWGAIEPWLKQVTLEMAGGVEFVAALVIAGAAIQAGVSVVRLALHRSTGPAPSERIRIQLGQWLSLALEFELAADILRTAVAPSWDQIGKLSAIVVIRTVINLFLQHDIAQARRREEQG